MKKILAVILLSLSIFACNNKNLSSNLFGKEKEQNSENLRKATVVKVYDGDTVTLADGTKLRLYGIDAPEKKQNGGMFAQQMLYSKIFGKNIEYDPINTDRYGRTVAKIYLNGEYINEYMVKNGGAWYYEEYAKNDYDLKNAFINAKNNKIGIFKDKNIENPSNYRREKREKRNNYNKRR